MCTMPVHGATRPKRVFQALAGKRERGREGGRMGMERGRERERKGVRGEWGEGGEALPP